MPITLYDFELDESCYKVRLTLSILGLKWQTVAVDVFPGKEHLTPSFLAMNPLGRLPILKDSGLTLHEPEAILAYLARAYDPAGLWLPASPDEFGQAMQWLIFAAQDLDVAIAARQHMLFGGPGDAGALHDGARKVLDVMEDHMIERSFAGAEWFAASNPTVADIALFPAFALSRDFGIDHGEFPALRRWSRRFRKLPGFITMPGIPHYS